ncbi:MAG: catalase family peroxidase [Caulobacteraceae bacterium]
MTDAHDPAPPPPLSTGAIVLRLGAIGGVVACAAGVFAYTAGWLTPHRLTQARMLAAFESDEAHPGFRFNHAKGLCATGDFQGSGQAVAVSKASVFKAERTPVNARFSLPGPMPFQPDSAQKVRALALRLVSADGQEWRTAMINLPIFPVNQPKDFYDFTLASAPVPATGKPDPAKMKAYLANHPATAKAVGLLKAAPPPAGFAVTKYNGLNAFRFTNAQGATTPVRWSFVPVQPGPAPDPAKPKDVNPNTLFDDVIAQVHQHPLQWKLMLTLGQPGDSTKDATIPWPANRQQVDAGVLTLDQVASEDGGRCTDINYDPLVLPAGMAGSDDPLLSARSSAYARSFRIRIEKAGQKKPSALTPQAVQTGGAA